MRRARLQPVGLRASALHRGLAGLVVLLGLGACAPQTGLLFQIQGPNGTSSVTAGIVDLELITSHPSYCGRWVTDTTSSGTHYTVKARDLETAPATLLVSPDARTDLKEPVRVSVLARDAAGQLLGVASFDAVRFSYEQVREYKQRIVLLGPGARSDGPRYLADDGCMCLPGRPSVGTASGTGCDQRIPPSFARLVDTAGCELPKGAALPVGVCDGQLYPGERANRTVPCYASRGGTCRIGQRVCNDENGLAFDRECTALDSAPALSSSTLCDAFLGCERTACGDPMPCFKQAVLKPKQVSCDLPLQPVSMGGAGQPCPGGSWQVSGGAFASSSCAAAMLDGTRVGVLTLGWLRAGETTAQVSSSLCPPTFLVEKIDIADPSKLPSEVTFSLTIDSELYDVTLHLKPECSKGLGAPDNNLRCQLN